MSNLHSFVYKSNVKFVFNSILQCFNITLLFKFLLNHLLTIGNSKLSLVYQRWTHLSMFLVPWCPVIECPFNSSNWNILLRSHFASPFQPLPGRSWTSWACKKNMANYWMILEMENLINWKYSHKYCLPL